MRLRTLLAGLGMLLWLPFSLAQPRINAGGVVGGGLGGVKQISPGGIISIFGTALAPSVRAVGTADLENGSLPARLNGVCVEVGTLQGRLFFVSPNQINLQVPAIALGSTTVRVVANCGAAGEVRSNAENVTVQAAAPEFFPYIRNADGSSAIAAIHAVTNAALGAPSLAALVGGGTFLPARVGDFVTLFATGLGATDPLFPVGKPPDQGAPVTQKVTVTLNGTALLDSDVLYAGVTPGFAGLYQVNVRIPANAPDGDVAMVVRIGAFSSPSGAFLTIRNPQGGGPAPDAVAVVEVSGPLNYAIAARTLALQARATTSFGATVDNFKPLWQTGSTAIATVDVNGVVRGVSPGIAEISAVAANGVAGRFSVRVYPQRIDLQPDSLDLRIGDKVSVIARALDADGKTLTGMRFLWSTGASSIASVDSNGQVTAVADGATSLTARLDFGSSGISGYDYSAQAAVNVRRKLDYQISRLISNDQQVNNATIRNITEAAFAGTDTFAFIADLSNGSRALLLSRAGNLQTLATAGQNIDAAGAIAYSFSNVAVNASGDVAVMGNFLVDNCNQTLLYFAFGKPAEAVASGCGLAWATALADNRDLWYTLNGDRSQILMLRKADGKVQKIMDSSDAALGVGKDTGFNRIALSGTPVGSRAVVEVGTPRGNVYFSWDGSTFRKLYGQNETVAGRLVNGSSIPLEGQSGEYYAQVWGPNYGNVLRFSGGSPTTFINNGENFGGVIFFNFENLLSVRGNDVLAQVNTDQGRMLFKFTRNSEGVSGTFLARLDDTNTRNGYLTATGNSMVAFSLGGPGIVRYGSVGQATLVSASATVGGAVNTSLYWNRLPRTSLTAAPVFRSINALLRFTGGSSQTLVNAASAITTGGPLLDTLGDVAAARNGDLAFCANTSRGSQVYTYRSGRFALLVDPSASDGDYYTTGGRRIDWIPCWDNSPMAMNTKGQVAAYAGVQGNNELTLFTEGSRTGQSIVGQNAAAPGGGSYSWIGGTALDENGRVLFIATLLDGSRGLYLWENSQVRRVLHSSGNAPNGARYSDAWWPMALNGKFYVGLNYDGGSEIGEYDGTTWRTIVRQGQNGFNLDRQRFAISSSGDVFYLASGSDGRQVRAKRADGRDLTVAKASERTPDGEWITIFYDLAATDTGDVFFSATTIKSGGKERASIFRATPQ